jgi:chromate reductase
MHAAQAFTQEVSMQILGIVGSLRKGSYNRALLRTCLELAPADMNIGIYDLNTIPLYNGDVEAQGVPESVQGFTEAIRKADGLLIATPEYNYSIPGVLKNAIDWASRPPQTTPLRGKPAGLIGASIGSGGTIRAQLHLRQSFVFTQTIAMLQPEVLVSKAQDKFDAEGRLTDEPTRKILSTFLEAFQKWVQRIHPA